MVKEKLIVILNGISDVYIDENRVNEFSSLANDFSFDSVKTAELIVSIEAEFNIIFDDEELDFEKLDSITYLIKMIESKME